MLDPVALVLEVLGQGHLVVAARCLFVAVAAASVLAVPAVVFVVDLEASEGKEVWEYVVALDSLLGLRVREYLLPVPYLQVLLFLYPVLGLEEICETNTKKLFSSSNYF